MKIILTSPSGRRWKIEPVDSGLCFAISKEPAAKIGKNGRRITAEWLSCDCYPSTLGSAVSRCIELMLTDGSDEQEIVVDVESLEALRLGLKLWTANIAYDISVDAKNVSAAHS